MLQTLTSTCRSLLKVAGRIFNQHQHQDRLHYRYSNQHLGTD